MKRRALERVDDVREAVGCRRDSLGDRLVALGRRINGAPSTLTVFEIGYEAGWRNGRKNEHPPRPRNQSA